MWLLAPRGDLLETEFLFQQRFQFDHGTVQAIMERGAFLALLKGQSMGDPVREAAVEIGFAKLRDQLIH